MRVVIQRVKSASVHAPKGVRLLIVENFDGKVVNEIGQGLMVLVGISRDDETKDAAYIARKLVNLRIFEDYETQKRWDKSVKQVGGEILCVSQFTLCSTLKGNKPDYRNAMAADSSRAFYESFLALVRAEYDDDKVKDGVFGAMMDVFLVNDGPVTITLDSPTSVSPQTTENVKNGDAGAS